LTPHMVWWFSKSVQVLHVHNLRNYEQVVAKIPLGQVLQL